MRDSHADGFRFLGCDDDLMGERRLEAKRAKNGARQSKFRTAHSTGNRRGRPRLELSPEERLARSNAQAVQRMRRRRAVTQKPVTRQDKETGSVTEFNGTTTPPTDSSEARLKRAPSPGFGLARPGCVAF
jgi:hypothetical protein